MKNVLIVIQSLRPGGVEKVAVNLASHLPQSEYNFTYYLQKIDAEQDPELLKTAQSENAKIIIRPEGIKGYVGKYKHIKQVMANEQYDVVHSHVMFYNGLVMRAAQKSGVKKRVSHSHAIRLNRAETLPFKVYRTFMQRWINRYATDKLACSVAAGNYLYGEKEYAKNGQFLSNGIDTQLFEYNADIRKEKREELKIADNEILVGHIGTIYYIKNQTFLVEVFSKMLDKNSNMRLILVGEEVDRDVVEERVKALGIADKVIFAGQRTDIPQLLQAMDIMIFPSLFEALPVSLIEAQASKLPCLISDTVTFDVKFNDNVDFMSLENSAETWSDKAFELLKIKRKDIATDKLKSVYDISSSAKMLDEIYNTENYND